MSKLFEATKINGMTLSNRFVRSATWEGMATEEGGSTPRLIAFMEKLARDGVGLIITGVANVRSDGQWVPRQLGAFKDEFIDGYKNMTKAVHNEGGKIVMQIAHGGIFPNPEITGQIPLAPSKVKDSVNGKFPSNHKIPTVGKEMNLEIIQEMIEDFRSAAVRAKESGFDGIQFFAGHGYLLSQFLSPVFIKRTDSYGGNLENRARILLEVLKNVRMTVGQNYPILVKINSEDFLEGGLTRDESLKVCVMLCDGGVDAIELSGGTWISGKNIPSRTKITPKKKRPISKKHLSYLRKRLMSH